MEMARAHGHYPGSCNSQLFWSGKSVSLPVQVASPLTKATFVSISGKRISSTDHVVVTRSERRTGERRREHDPTKSAETSIKKHSSDGDPEGFEGFFRPRDPSSERSPPESEYDARAGEHIVARGSPGSRLRPSLGEHIDPTRRDSSGDGNSRVTGGRLPEKEPNEHGGEPTAVRGSRDSPLRPSVNEHIDSSRRDSNGNGDSRVSSEIRGSIGSRAGRNSALEWEGKDVRGGTGEASVHLRDGNTESAASRFPKEARKSVRAVWRRHAERKADSAVPSETVTKEFAVRAGGEAAAPLDPRLPADSESRGSYCDEQDSSSKSTQYQRQAADNNEDRSISPPNSRGVGKRNVDKFQKRSAASNEAPQAGKQVRASAVWRPTAGETAWRGVGVKEQAVAAASELTREPPQAQSETRARSSCHPNATWTAWRGVGVRERAAAVAAEVRIRGLVGAAEVVECVTRHDLAVDNRTFNLRATGVSAWRGVDVRERAAAVAAEVRTRGLVGAAEVVECVTRHDLAVDNRTLNLLLAAMVGGRAVSSTGDAITKLEAGGGDRTRKPNPPVVGSGDGSAVFGAGKGLEEKDWEGAKVVVAAFQAAGVELNERIYTTLISCYGKGGRMEGCWGWLCAMERQWGVAHVQGGVAQGQGGVAEGNVAARGEGEKGEREGVVDQKGGLLPEDIYGVMLGACVQCLDWKGALAIYHHLCARGAAVVVAERATTTATVKAASPATAEEAAEALPHRQQQQQQQQRMPTAHQFGLVLRACARAGRWQLARDLLLAADDVFVTNTIAGYPTAAPGVADSAGGADGAPVTDSAAGAADSRGAAGAVGSAVATAPPPLSPHHPPLATSPAMFTDVITACARSAQPIPALRLLDRLESHPSPAVHADVAAYTAAISACASVGQWENAIRLLNRMQQQPMGKEVAAGTGTSGAFPFVHRGNEVRRKLEVRGKEELRQKPVVRPNVVTWTAVMSACAAAGRADVARELLTRMMAEGSGEGKKGKGEGGMRAYEKMEANVGEERENTTCVTADATSDATSACHPNVVTWTVALSACARAGEWEQAESLFTQMQTNGVMPNVVSWAALISAYAKGGQWEKAVGILRLMRSGGGWGENEKGKGGRRREKEEEKEHSYSLSLPLHLSQPAQLPYLPTPPASPPSPSSLLPPLSPSSPFPLPTAWNAALHACATAGKWKLLGSLFREMQEAGCPSSVVTYGVLVGGYGRVGQAGLAREAFDSMIAAGIRPNAVVCASMVRAYARARQFGQAMKFFEAMPGMGVVPDKYAYTALLWACGACGQWHRADKIFERMKRQGCVPDGITYRTLIESYEMNGEWDKSMKALEDMNSLSVRLLQRPQPRRLPRQVDRK